MIVRPNRDFEKIIEVLDDISNNNNVIITDYEDSVRYSNGVIVDCGDPLVVLEKYFEEVSGGIIVNTPVFGGDPSIRYFTEDDNDEYLYYKTINEVREATLLTLDLEGQLRFWKTRLMNFSVRLSP